MFLEHGGARAQGTTTTSPVAKLDVLSSLCAADDATVLEREYDLTLAIAAHDADVVAVRERREAARHAERLQDVHIAPDREFAWLVDLADDVDALAS